MTQDRLRKSSSRFSGARLVARVGPRVGARAGVGVALIALVLASACASPSAPRPRTAYQAEVEFRFSKADSEAPERLHFLEFYSDRKRRLQSRSVEPEWVAIDRPALRVAWILSPDSRTFDEHRITTGEAVVLPFPHAFGPRLGANFEALALTTRDGVAVREYSVRGDVAEGRAWISEDGVPFRFEGTIRWEDVSYDVSIRYSGIERGPQAAYLFAIPPYYAGYEDRAKPYERSQQDVNDAAATLRRAGRNRPSGPFPIPPPPPPPPPPPRY